MRQNDKTPPNCAEPGEPMPLILSLGSRGAFWSQSFTPCSAEGVLTRKFSDLLPSRGGNSVGDQGKPGASPIKLRIPQSGTLLLVPYPTTPFAAALWRRSCAAFRVERLDPLKADQMHKPWPPNWESIAFKPERYRQNVKTAIEDIQEQIRQGRFYQLNLLRYFQTATPLGEMPFLQRVLQSTEPYRFFLADRSRDMTWASLSPERFCSLEPDPSGNNLTLATFPIKGTIRRQLGMDPQQERLKLDHSNKDRAELAMIIDLMRHDLSAVCKRITVQVTNPGQVLSFASVHHLQGEVQGVLDPELTLWDFIVRLCPAGSITGAPKREVQLAIAELEGRERGFHMGNMFFLSDEGWIDSSVLIRTAIKQPKAGEWSFAAGSGITLRSDAESELNEMAVKTSCFGHILGEEGFL